MALYLLYRCESGADHLAHSKEVNKRSFQNVELFLKDVLTKFVLKMQSILHVPCVAGTWGKLQSPAIS